MFSGLNIVIVNWNLITDTIACLESLFAAGAESGQVILIDNGSTDGSVEALRSQFGSAVVIFENENNLGYAPACNQGIQYALSSKAEWVLLLNNDTLVDPGFLHEMETAAIQAPAYQILAPLIFYASQPDRVWYLGDRLIPGTLITTNPYRDKPADPRLPELLPVDFVSGCAMLVKRQVFEKIGLLDPSFVMYGEETDFCWRARQAGFQLAGVTKARLWHKISLSANRDLPQTRYLRIRNQIRVYRRYGRGSQRPLMFIFTILRALRIGLADLMNRQTGLIRPLVKGWLDGWRAA